MSIHASPPTSRTEHGLVNQSLGRRREQLAELVSGCRPREVVTLRELASQLAQRGGLLGLLDALCGPVAPAALSAPSPRAGCPTGVLIAGQPPKVVLDLSVFRSPHPCSTIRGLDPLRDGSPSARSPASVVAGSTGRAARSSTSCFTAPASRGAPRPRRCALPVAVRGWPGGVYRAQKLGEPATHDPPEARRYLACERVAGSSHRVQANA